MATLRRRTGTPVTSLPSNQTVPELGASSPAISRIRLVFPESVGPSRTFNVPRSSVSDTLAMCVAPPTILETFLNSSIVPLPDRSLFRCRGHPPACFSVNELGHVPGLAFGKFQPPLRAPPQDVFRREGPLFPNKISYFGLVE